MKVSELQIPDLKVFEPQIIDDDRGYFFESFNQKKFNDALGANIIFVQDNQSKSSKGILRGLHFQKEPFCQGKLVRVLSGEVFDVAVDIRKNSKTFSQWEGIYLNCKNKKQLWIPPGFAHGFMVTSEEAVFAYKVTQFFNKEHEVIIRHDDESLAIGWPKNIQKKFSDKDGRGISFANL
jgi:dTDP-4-dehydrorhamnose 3,5-epimerase